MENKLFFIKFLLLSIVYGYIGWWIGTKLITINSFQTFKILNSIGLTFDLFGIIILSRLVSSNQKWQSFISGKFAEQFLGFLLSSIIGLILCSYFGPNGPSKSILQPFAFNALFFFVMPIMLILQALVVGIDNKPPWSEEVRAKLLGGFFLVYGILIQIYASIIDLYN